MLKIRLHYDEYDIKGEKMRRNLLKIIPILLLTTSNLFSQSSQNRIAVLNLDAVSISNAESITLSDRLRSEMVNSGSFTVIERSEMDPILKEQGFQQSGCTSDECAVEIGKLLNINRICAGGVGKVGSVYTVTLRMIDVETGQILETVTEDCPCPIEQVLTSSMKNVVQKLVTASKGRGDIYIKSNPTGASVHVDGRSIGKTTPATIRDIDSGEHLVKAVKGDYVGSKVVNVQANTTTEASITLGKAKGHLILNNLTPGSEVFIDGRKTDQGANEFKVPIGVHNVEIERSGYESKTYNYISQENKSKSVNGILSRKTNGNALWRSILLPGWGQAYQEKSVQTWLYPILVAGGMGGSYLMVNNYNTAVDDYDKARELYLEAFSDEDINRTRTTMDKAYDDVESAENTRNIMFIATGAIWLWNVLDTVILPPGYKNKMALSARSEDNKILAGVNVNF